jgi:hypothetical protein
MSAHEPAEPRVPEYAREDPPLTAVIDDRNLDEVPEKTAGPTVAEWLPRRRLRPLCRARHRRSADRRPHSTCT